MLTMRQKKAVTKELRDRYQRAFKKEKTIMLNEFIQLTRHNRSYAARALRIKWSSPDKTDTQLSDHSYFFVFLRTIIPEKRI